jgi:hypothetical protein
MKLIHYLKMATPITLILWNIPVTIMANVLKEPLPVLSSVFAILSILLFVYAVIKYFKTK